MENLLCFFTIFVSLLLVILFKTKISTSKLPPGPWKLPVIGNIHHIFGYDLRHRRLRGLATKYGPIMHLQLGQIQFIVISSSELAKEVMKTQDLIFASRPITLASSVLSYNERDIFGSPYGDYWRQLRKICNLELFSTKRVQSFRFIREEEVSYLIRSIASSSGAPVNFSRMIVALLYCIISRSAFGKALNQEDAFTPTIRKAVSFFDAFRLRDLFPCFKILDVITGFRYKLQKMHQEVDTIMEDIIKEHRERKKSDKKEQDDLVDVLLSLQDHGKLDIPLTTQDIKAVLMDIFLGGVHTTSATIEWVMSELVKHPNVMERAQEEVRKVYNEQKNIYETSLHNLKYLNSVIKETLRLPPPATLLVPREAREGAEICGHKIPKKTQVLVNAWAIGRDPDHWIEPERFYPDRFLNSEVDYKGTHFEYVPFGAGRRICPGMLYAISIVEIVLASLLYHFDWMVPNGVKNEDLDMSETFGIVTRRRNELYLVPTLQIPQ